MWSKKVEKVEKVEKLESGESFCQKWRNLYIGYSRVVTVYKRESLVAASKGSLRAGRLRATQSKEDWVLLASAAALRAQREEGNSEDAVMRARSDQVRSLKRRADSIRLTADGVVPLDLTCPSSRVALLRPAGTAFTNNGIAVATDGSLKRDERKGEVMVSKDNGLPARGVAVFGQSLSLQPELSGIALALEDCPGEEDLSVSSPTASAP